MKNKEMAVEPGRKKGEDLRGIEEFFQSNDLVAVKQMLSSIMQYAVNGKDWIKEEPSVVLKFYESLRLLIHEGDRISRKAGKWKVKEGERVSSLLMMGALSHEEYENPLLVFERAFEEYNARKFDYFISGIVYYSLRVYRYGPEGNLVGPYIHLNRMLDAAYIILQRGIQKRKKGGGNNNKRNESK
ncbi:hypothetical protein EG344_23815 [Chryseobacterium sp. G0162]|uniref:hypothetical protein n=1 Tax=Chryseobacterium sp. G0162 TaxID=2487063 RepID=UPI000F700039|nr:hypothetical protein [Chryseobacterium sp. G0162]AZB11638.1 hypothetical protein EG344_23815 [Chryseobacterium sp. G0162]